MFRVVLVGQLVGLCIVLSADARGQIFRSPPPAEVVQNSLGVMEDLAARPLEGIPASLLADAQGVVICPNVIKLGFVVGGRHGTGVLLVKRPDGTWSLPIILRINGGSVGWQAGVQATDVVLVLKTRRSVDGILSGRRLTLGADASIAAGPLGRQGAVATDARLQSEIFSYSRSRGLFAGVALDGSSLRIDPPSNEAYYGRSPLTATEIVEGSGLPETEATVALRDSLTRQVQARLVPAPTLGDGTIR